MKLHTRLLLSYFIVLAITLSVIVVALFVFLSARPAPPQPVYQDIGLTIQAHLRQIARPRQGTMLRQLRAPEQVMAQLNTFAEESGVRILVVNVESQQINYDSAEAFTAEDQIDWQLAPEYLPSLPPALRLLSETNRVTTGGFQDVDGSQWLFVDVNLQAQQGSTALVYALPRPAQSLGTALSDFNQALAVPIFQAAFTGVVVAVFMAVVVSRTIVRPLLHIADGARAVADGDYDQQVPVIGPPEVQTVAESFNHMTSQVKAAQQAQHDFMVNVSHDLKTPLTSIQGFSQAIMDGATSDPVEAATVIHEEAARLNRMVVEITDLARLQDGQMALKMVELDISQIVAAIGQRLAIVAEKKQIDLQMMVTPMPLINGDGDRLAQVITNLISNAIKYTPRAGKVAVKTQVSSGGVEIHVQDTGIGIPKEDLPRIFERFYQVDKARGPRRGTGLGLAITREIVQAHGGTIRVTSAADTPGTTFTVWLPSQHVNTVTSH